MELQNRKLHYKKCVYPNCGLVNRNSIGVTFHRFPTYDKERCLTWLVNCGLDDWVEMTDIELKKKYVCSRHFLESSFRSRGLLEQNAEPKIYYRDENDINENNSFNVDIVLKERKVLEKRLMETEDQLKQEKNRYNILRLQFRAKCKALHRLQNNLSSGNIDDTCLKKAIATRVSGFIFTFIIMLLFKMRKFTHKQQQICMAMHYTSPALYNKMRNIFGFHLPSPKSIIRWFGKIDIWPGICQNLFAALKIKATHMEVADRNCVLLFDEMYIKKCFDFHPTKQIIEGFEDLGSLGRSTAVGSRVLVFMLRGLFSNWKQPLAFFVTKSGISKDNLNYILDEILDAVYDTGFKVRAVISDQGRSNTSIADDRTSIENPYFIKNSQKIYFIFDFLHLFKSVRNNLLKYNFEINGSVVSWSDVIALWNLEKNKTTRAACKLSNKHIWPNTFDKMKCKLALQVFSKRVSSALFTASLTDCIKTSTVQHTASFFEILNDLFDNLNSRSVRDPNPNKCALSRFYSDVEQNLKLQASNMANWFIKTPKGLKKPICFLGLQQSVNATLQLWDDLQEEDITFLITSRLNTDALENFFSILRMQGGSYNRNPSVKAVRIAIKKNILLSLEKSGENANCMSDNDTPLVSEDCIPCEQAASLSAAPFDYSVNVEHTDDDSIDVDNDFDYEIHNLSPPVCSLETCAMEYFAGYIAEKSVDKTKCINCYDTLILQNAIFPRNEQLLLFFRAYITEDNVDFGHLCVPSPTFSEIFKIINKVFDSYYPRLRSEAFILDKLFSYISSSIEKIYPKWFNHDECAVHRKDLVYFVLKVKINKDTVWLGEKLSFFGKSMTNKYCHFKNV